MNITMTTDALIKKLFKFCPQPIKSDFLFQYFISVPGCYNKLPGCGTALCSVQDKHTRMPIFYNLFQ